MIIDINTHITGFNEELKREAVNISAVLERTYPQILNEMRASLQKHISEDWYSAYKPHAYQRRTDNPSLAVGNRGLPLGDEANMAYTSSRAGLFFAYNPAGGHADEEWYDRDYDELITSIQTGELLGSPPPRPFWNNFVRDTPSIVCSELRKSINAEGYKININENEINLTESMLPSVNQIKF